MSDSIRQQPHLYSKSVEGIATSLERQAFYIQNLHIPKRKEIDGIIQAPYPKSTSEGKSKNRRSREARMSALKIASSTKKAS